MGVSNILWSRMAKKPGWLLVLIALLIPLSGYWSFVSPYGQPILERECKAYKAHRGVIVFADSQGFTDKRHVKVCASN